MYRRTRIYWSGHISESGILSLPGRTRFCKVYTGISSDDLSFMLDTPDPTSSWVSDTDLRDLRPLYTEMGRQRQDIGNKIIWDLHSYRPITHNLQEDRLMVWTSPSLRDFVERSRWVVYLGRDWVIRSPPFSRRIPGLSVDICKQGVLRIFIKINKSL